MKDVDIKALLEDDKSRIALFVTCEFCAGTGSFVVNYKGGPYGIGGDRIEPCRRCYMEHGRPSGQRLVTMPLKNFLEAIRMA